MRKLFILFGLELIIASASGQSLSNLRSKTVSIKPDTLIIDTLSIAPGSLLIKSGMDYSINYIDTSAYKLDFIHSKIIWRKESPAYKSLQGDSVIITYRAFSFLLGKEFKNKNADLIVSDTFLDN